MHNPPGWGLAWLLGEAGDMVDIGPDVVGMTCSPGGARLTFRRGTATAQGGFVLAWALPKGGIADVPIRVSPGEFVVHSALVDALGGAEALVFCHP